MKNLYLRMQTDINTNWAYGTASYSKGNIFLSQLEYVIGKENVAERIKKIFYRF